ncbi:hypothetical protein [Terrihabitans sp. B22-R8]|uniref:hypothetical protein n=1 Tax=Terrihabitans sp. B22-R8 TaxID=3425128 RepID=UPI00403C9C1A
MTLSAKRVVMAVIVGAAVGFGMMMWDKSRGAEWVVSPQQIEAAKASGQMGVDTGNGSVAVLPIRSEKADALPFKWAMFGIGAGVVTFFSGRKRKTA